MYQDVYLNGLQECMNFWFPSCIDFEHGGYNTSLDRFGKVINPDKSVWFQGRTAWTLMNVYNSLGEFSGHLPGFDLYPLWAKHGLDFIQNHCFDTDGRMFFTVTQSGEPLRKRRYVFSECFAIIAMAAYSIGTGETAYREKALQLFKLVNHWLDTPGILEPKTDPRTRPMRGLGTPMILLNVASELRKAYNCISSKTEQNNNTEQNSNTEQNNNTEQNSNTEQNNNTEQNSKTEQATVVYLTEMIDSYIQQVERYCLKPEFHCVLETVGPNGEFLDSFDGRQINPGHSLEAAWFILAEAEYRGGDSHLRNLGLQICDWSWNWGWDNEYGGILYYRDCKNYPCTEYWHDMKFWWPQNEAVIANMLAWEITKDPLYAQRHRLVHEWAFTYFPDTIASGGGGEWFGYLHRDGSLSTPVKGNLFKGPFHIPRMMTMGILHSDSLPEDHSPVR